jgi:hypothetical protein
MKILSKVMQASRPQTSRTRRPRHIVYMCFFSALFPALFLLTGCGPAPKSGVEGFWIGAFSPEGNEQIGNFLKIAPPDVTAVLVSDHGLKTHIKRKPGNEHSVAYHEREGVYLFSGPGFKHGHERNGFSIYDICLLVLNRYGLAVASDMPGEVQFELYSSLFLRTKSKKQLKTLGYISE